MWFVNQSQKLLNLTCTIFWPRVKGCSCVRATWICGAVWVSELKIVSTFKYVASRVDGFVCSGEDETSYLVNYQHNKDKYNYSPCGSFIFPLYLSTSSIIDVMRRVGCWSKNSKTGKKYHTYKMFITCQFFIHEFKHWLWHLSFVI